MGFHVPRTRTRSRHMQSKCHIFSSREINEHSLASVWNLDDLIVNGNFHSRIHCWHLMQNFVYLHAKNSELVN